MESLTSEFINPDIMTSLVQEKRMMLNSAKDFQITDEKSLGYCNDLLQGAKNILKSIEGKEKELTKPLNDTKQKIIDAFKPHRLEMKEIIDNLSKKVIDYQLALQKQMADFKRAEDERLRKEHEKASASGDVVEAITLENKINEVNELKTETRIDSKFSTSNISTTWDFEVVVPSSVPLEYLSPDEKKIKEAVNSGVRNINGVRIFEKHSLRNRNS